MNDIYIGFSTPKKFRLTSKIIQLFEGSKYSHIYIRMNKNKVFQASHGIVNAINFKNFQEDNKIIQEFNIKVDDDDFKDVRKTLWNYLGRPYGFLQLIGIALNIKMFTNDDSKFICSELAANILKNNLGYDIKDDLDYIGLNDIQKILIEHIK